MPHFEKMLYDNAQLLELLALAHQRSGNALFRTRARETVDWLTREMTTAEGAFCASLDADSEGEEGKFYVWSLDEIERGPRPGGRRLLCRHYDVTAEGNFEGHTILNRSSAYRAAGGRGTARRDARKLLRRARRAYARGSTTRCWPIGTG